MTLNPKNMSVPRIAEIWLKRSLDTSSIRDFDELYIQTKIFKQREELCAFLAEVLKRDDSALVQSALVAGPIWNYLHDERIPLSERLELLKHCRAAATSISQAGFDTVDLEVDLAEAINEILQKESYTE